MLSPPFLRDLSDVESIVVPLLNEAAMAHISRLPNLKSLAFDVFPDNWSAPVVHTTQTFQALHELTLCYPTVDESIAFVEWLSQVPLTSLTIDFSSGVDPSQMHALLSAVSAGILHPCLSKLSIGSDCTRSAGYCVENRSLRLLFCFVNLTDVSIAAGGGYDIDDSMVADLSLAWPLIENLRLTDGETRTTLACLSSFVANCPRLTGLGLAFNTTVIPHATTTAVHGLASLDVSCSTISISKIVPVARFLAAIFPELKQLDAARNGAPPADSDDEEGIARYDEAMESKRCWKEVESLCYNINFPSIPSCHWTRIMISVVVNACGVESQLEHFSIEIHHE
ncbi:hypothetical protein MSAN_01133300 [Mycena sanguinolenta]|uniref:Uncharacterized protein n=1 Tax=Mycena sanguinolenta TaxID=230812 RepID=A0A8H7D3P6_9AGAR|nr:hypothetical protein MSAN_01133300 [Mycena sanguinolenta]